MNELNGTAFPTQLERYDQRDRQSDWWKPGGAFLSPKPFKFRHSSVPNFSPFLPGVVDSVEVFIFVSAQAACIVKEPGTLGEAPVVVELMMV